MTPREDAASMLRVVGAGLALGVLAALTINGFGWLLWAFGAGR